MLRGMNATRFAAALAAMLLTLPALAEKPQLRPYAAGSPSGGIPLWNPGEKFVAIAGGACSGNCPVYELYVFDDGRVTFLGRKDTGKTGVWKKQVDAQAYAELLTIIIRLKAFDEKLKRGACLKGRPMLTIMRSEPDGQSMLMQSLNSGCDGFADITRQIESLFFQWTEVENWIAPSKR